MTQSQAQALTSPGGSGTGTGARPLPRVRAQGRFIVQAAGTRNAKAHHVSVDLEGAVVDKVTGNVARNGTFSSVAARVPQLAREGSSLLVVHGAIERDCGWGESEEADEMARALLQSTRAGAGAGKAHIVASSPAGGARDSDSPSHGDDAQSVRSEESAIAAVAASGLEGGVGTSSNGTTNPADAVQRLGIAASGEH